MSTEAQPVRMDVVFPFEQASLLLAIYAEVCTVRRKRDEHKRTHWTGPSGKLTLPIDTVRTICNLADELDAVLASGKE